MIKRLVTVLGVSGLAALAVFGCPDAAQARSVPFMDGRTDSAFFIPCVAVDFQVGSVVNRALNTGAQNSACGTVFYEVPLPLDNAGSKSATFSASASDPPSATQCRAMGISRDQKVQTSSGFFASTVLNRFATVNISAITVPTGGYMYLDCDLPVGTQYSTVTYNQ